MDYVSALERIYEHIENGHVDKAVVGCVRVARHLKDYLSAATFLREMYPTRKDVARVIHDDTNHLAKEAQKFIWDTSLSRWLDLHTLDNALGGTSDDGEERNVFAIGVGELDSEIEQCERSIADMALPRGMGEFDTAAFTDRYHNQKVQLRLRIRSLYALKERIRSRCLNYAISVERQLDAQRKAQRFLDQIENDVNNFFKDRSDDVYTKLQKASQLIDSDDSEDRSLLLAEVRRAIKSAADYFYPATTKPVRCADGIERTLGEEQYLNRLQEFLAASVRKSTSRELLNAEFQHLAQLARRLNDVAAKGVHAGVSVTEAKQGLLGLYLFLFNVISHLQSPTEMDEPAPSDTHSVVKVGSGRVDTLK